MDAEQERLMVLSVGCPTCHVPKGSACRTLMHGREMMTVHTLRRGIVKRNEKERLATNEAIRKAF